MSYNRKRAEWVRERGGSDTGSRGWGCWGDREEEEVVKVKGGEEGVAQEKWLWLLGQGGLRGMEVEVRKCQFEGEGCGGEVEELKADEVDVLDWMRERVRLGRSSCWMRVLKEVRVLRSSSTWLMSKGSPLSPPPSCWLRSVVRT